MKIIIECEKCGNRIELSSTVSETNTVEFDEALWEKDFVVSSDIQVELMEETVSDEEDVDAMLDEVDIHCDKCDDVIYLKF